ncbi:hypothetical protein T484DRAFT_1608112 [Baffinella frigidus]|nr:hypothetical protein T484DRAFT_1608112 [Cryptophyta sp. CCMP2293]
MMSGLGGMVMQGMAMGTGSAIAHRAVDSMMGPRQVEHVNTDAPAAAAAPQAMAGGGNSCTNENDMFSQCVKNAGGDTSACQSYLDMLTNCKKSTPPAPPSSSISGYLGSPVW